MPYKQIHWIKLEKRLINDHRFFLMSEKAQLYYIKLLMLCAITNNKVPRKYEVFKTLLRTDCTKNELDSVMEEIKINFPKVLFHKDLYSVREFKSKHNWVSPRNSQGSAKELVDKSKNKIRKEKSKDLQIFTYLKNKSFEEMFESYISGRKNKATSHAKELILKDLHKHDLKTAIAMLEKSIKNGWQGVFELKTDKMEGRRITA